MQGGAADHTYYTQVNMTRTIEQILGLPPMNQFDLVASPMATAFVQGDPPKSNYAPFTHIPAQYPLDKGVNANSYPKGAMAQAWRAAKAKIFAGKATRPDSEDQDAVNHLTWYEATEFKRPYPGESRVRPPSDFKDLLAQRAGDADD